MSFLSKTRRWNPLSLALILLAWLILQLGGLFSPGLLDDVDSVYIEIAREMLHRHDLVTPYIDGIRFFDKPPLMYWLAAGSMRLFGEHDWAARLPLALAVLALFLALYSLALFLYPGRPAAPDRPALYTSLLFATAIGPYLYTRFFIPDILICLWMTLGVHAFLLALTRAEKVEEKTEHVILSEALVPHSSTAPPSMSGNPKPSVPHSSTAPSSMSGNPTHPVPHSSTASPSMSGKYILPTLLFAATLALNLLTKGLIGLVFPLGFVFFYLTLTRQWSLLRRLPLLAATAVFFLIALPWHILAALRNPAIPMPSGLGLPAHAGWAWFYLYNEHVARFLGRRIPHDYGQTPVWLFWLYAVLWMMPWAAFLPAAVARTVRRLRSSAPPLNPHCFLPSLSIRNTTLAPVIWALFVMVFFTLSSRQEYYSLPALPAFALLLGPTFAAAEDPATRAAALVRACHRWLLLPLTSLVAVVCLYFAITAPAPAPGADLSSLLASNPELYNLSLGHLFDLTSAAMGLFRGPLILTAVGFALIGLISFLLRRANKSFQSNMMLATGSVVVLLAAHEGLVRFNPILGSKSLADAILADQSTHPNPNDVILLDGELTSGSTLLFYTRQPVHLVNGRINGPWFGSFWPDSPQVFENEDSLRRLWAGPQRVYLLTYAPASRVHDLRPYAPVQALASAGGKTILVNR